MMDRSDPRAVLAGLRPERRRRILGFAAGLLLGTVVVLVVAEPETGLAAVTLALGALFLLAQPHWGILAVWVLMMTRISPARIGPLSTSELIAATLAFPLALEIVRHRGIWVWHVPQIRLLLAIGGVLLAAAGWSVLLHPAPPVAGLEETSAELFFFGEQLLFVTYFVYFIKTRRHLNHAAVVILVMLLVLAVSGLLFGGSPGHRRIAAGFEGFAANENRLGFLCVWGTALFWSLRFKGPRGAWRPLTLVPLLVLPITVLMTGSRSGFLQLALLGGLILLEQGQWSPAQRVRAFTLTLAIALAIIAITPNTLLQRATSLDAGGPTTIDRLYTYQAGAVMMTENPVFGVGPGNFQWRNQVLTGRAMSPHNSYLWALTTGGPLLLILYLAILHRSYRMLRAIERGGGGEFAWLATALRINLVIFLVFSFFADIWLAEPFSLLVGLTIVLVRITRAAAEPIATAPPAGALATI